jgi:hypothetical protein
MLSRCDVDVYCADDDLIACTALANGAVPSDNVSNKATNSTDVPSLDLEEGARDAVCPASSACTIGTVDTTDLHRGSEVELLPQAVELCPNYRPLISDRSSAGAPLNMEHAHTVESCGHDGSCYAPRVLDDAVPTGQSEPYTEILKHHHQVEMGLCAARTNTREEAQSAAVCVDPHLDLHFAKRCAHVGCLYNLELLKKIYHTMSICSAPVLQDELLTYR